MIPDPLAEVLMHALGLDERRRDLGRRNQYVTAADDPDVAQLVTLGLMAPTRTPSFLPDGERNFIVTDAGKREALAANDRINPVPKMTASARRYRLWMDSGADDCGITFGDFLKLKLYQRMNA